VAGEPVASVAGEPMASVAGDPGASVAGEPVASVAGRARRVRPGPGRVWAGSGSEKFLLIESRSESGYQNFVLTGFRSGPGLENFSDRVQIQKNLEFIYKKVEKNQRNSS